MKIINNKREELVKQQKEIREYNKELSNTNTDIIENNNLKWSISVFCSVILLFIIFAIITADISFIAIKYIFITILSLISGMALGTKIASSLYKPLESVRHETVSMRLSYLLTKYKPLAIARKGNNYLLVMEDKDTKVAIREFLDIRYVEKTNINEIVLDVDNETLYLPYKK